MYLFIRAPADVVHGVSARPHRVCLRRRIDIAKQSLVKQRPIWLNCASSSPSDDPKPKKMHHESDDVIRRPASGTLIGRVAVEVLALMAGVMLLVLVAIWKATTVLALYFWRALVWLSKVRRLGRWVLSMAVTLARSPRSLGIAVFAAVQLWIGALVAYIRTLTRRRKEDHVEVRAERVVDDEATEAVSKEIGDMRRELRQVREMIERRESAAMSSAASVADPQARLGNKSESVQSGILSPDEVDGEVGQEAPVPDVMCSSKTRLILLRHAKSEFDRSGRTADHERALSEAGQKEAQLVGAELKRRGWSYDSVVCSNARRTLQTLDLVNSDEDPSSSLVVTENLYYAVSGDEMASVLDSEAPSGLQPGSCRLIVAHSPGICELIERLTGEKPTMSTACAALLEYPREASSDDDVSWPGSLTECEGKWSLVDIIRPKFLQ